MTESVRLRDGLEIDLATGERVVCDASRPDADVTIYTHAHGDHLYTQPPATAVMSELTRDLAAVRRPDTTPPAVTDHPAIDLLDAGHVPGSRAALIHDERTYLYTGDVCTRDRLYLDGFDPPDADVLVVESTYGSPEYVFPPVADVRAAFEDWLARSPEVPVVCFGYPLGRAQELCALLAESERERVFASDAIRALNRTVADALGVPFRTRAWSAENRLQPGDALVLPSGTSSFEWAERLVRETGARTAGFSGWAVDDSYKFANGFDETFVLSDHCDFEELVALVDAVDPTRVYTLHGQSRAFARYLTSTEGYPATALQRNQASLTDF